MDFIPALANIPLYQIVILLCLATSLNIFVQELFWRNLKRFPGAVCVVGLLPAVILSHIAHGDSYNARVNGSEFAKIIAYYLLLLGLVDSQRRLKSYLFALVCFVTSVALASVLVYHGFLDIPALAPLTYADHFDPATGEPIETTRLMATGIFSDPNDFSIILFVAIMLGTYWAISSKNLFRKGACVLVIGLLSFAFLLTRSRGGMLALLGGGTLFLVQKAGLRRTLPLAAIAIPFLIMVGGRQTSFNLDDRNDTAQGRMELWRGAFQEFKSSPIFGIGTNELATRIGLVAHNSYIQTYAEMGIFGGTLFFGAIVIPIVSLRPQMPSDAHLFDRDFMSLRQCIRAATFGYAIGFCSLTRCYTLSTYLVLGIAGALCKLQFKLHPETMPRLSVRLLTSIFLGGLGLFIIFNLFVRFFGG